MTRIDTRSPVRVTVTTIRADQEDGTRRVTMHGPFDDAVLEALQARLPGWAVDQVLGRVLARRPPAGEAVKYEGSFSPVRHLQVVVMPAECPVGEMPTCPTRQLSGLFLPEHTDGQR